MTAKEGRGQERYRGSQVKKKKVTANQETMRPVCSGEMLVGLAGK